MTVQPGQTCSCEYLLGRQAKLYGPVSDQLVSVARVPFSPLWVNKKWLSNYHVKVKKLHSVALTYMMKAIQCCIKPRAACNNPWSVFISLQTSVSVDYELFSAHNKKEAAT